MKKLWNVLGIVVIMMILTAVSAGAMVNDTLKVGLRYGSTAMFSANLENAVGGGYELGYFDDDRDFIPLGYLEETTISMTAAGNIYLSGGTYSSSGSGQLMGKWHAQLEGVYDTFEEAQEEAWCYDGGYPAWINGEYVVRIGCYETADEAEAEGLGEAVSSSNTGVMVTVTRTDTVLFEFDCQGALSLGILPDGQGEDAVTWFRGYKYYGGFEYPRITGGNLYVINVVDVESYVKGVVPYEMNPNWSQAALEAQAVCARTYASRTVKHLNTYGFDVCNTTDCQVYNGTNTATANSDEAVENTEGLRLYYDGALIDAVYSSSNGGASEDAANVWGGKVPYLQGKEDPYEGLISIPNYSYSVTYTAAQLTWILQQKGYSIGTIRDVYVSEFTDMGNVYKVTFEDTSGKTLTVKGETCRTIFYSSTYGKSVGSMRFDIQGGSGGRTTKYYVNRSSTLSDLEGVSVISGTGKVTKLAGEGLYVRTASGTSVIGGKTTSGSSSGDSFTVAGTGSGHNVGLSQYGAKAMAENGYTFEEILEFYYTDITIG